jgi:glycerol uptake facilitator protein
VLLDRSKAQNAGWVVITAGWAFAVMCGIFTATAFGTPGFINPVGPIVEMVTGNMAIDRGLAMIAGEFLGAFCGAVLVWLHYLPHWPVTPDADRKLAVFCTGPAIRQPTANLLSEVIGTFVLIFVSLASVTHKPVSGLGPYLTGMLVWSIGLSLGATTGYAINPARDLAPRLAHAVLPIAGKGGSDWGYAWIPVVGPIIGGVVAALLFQALLGR